MELKYHSRFWAIRILLIVAWPISQMMKWHFCVEKETVITSVIMRQSMFSFQFSFSVYLMVVLFKTRTTMGNDVWSWMILVIVQTTLINRFSGCRVATLKVNHFVSQDKKKQSEIKVQSFNRKVAASSPTTQARRVRFPHGAPSH